MASPGSIQTGADSGTLPAAPGIARSTLGTLAALCAVAAVLCLVALMAHPSAIGSKTYQIGLRSAVTNQHGAAAMAMPASATTPSGTAAVQMKMYAFSPAALTVPVGTTVVWTNEDTAPHTVTVSDGPEKFSSPNLQKGDSFSFTFTKPGTYSYFCAVHPDMTATVTVTGSAPSSAPPTSAPAPSSSAPATQPAPTPSMSMPAPSGDGSCEVSHAMQAFVQHFNSGHLSESPEQQAQDIANFDQYVKTHTVLIENMFAPMTSGGGLANILSSPVQTFLVHVNSGHLGESPMQQAQDIANFNQYVLTHTVLIENMLKPAEAQACCPADERRVAGRLPPRLAGDAPSPFRRPGKGAFRGHHAAHRTTCRTSICPVASSET